MFDGMMIPFIMLLIITVALILERKYHEDKIVDIYEKKYEEWKEHGSSTQKEEKKYKELVGLVFKEDNTIIIESFDQTTNDKIDRKKYTTVCKEYS